MSNDKTTRVLKSAAAWLLRRAKSRANADTRAAYRDAIEIISQLYEHARTSGVPGKPKNVMSGGKPRGRR